MACHKGAAATAEKITSDDEWVKLEPDSDWVFVHPFGNDGNNEDAGEGNPDSSSDVDGVGNEDQNTAQSSEFALSFHHCSCEIDLESKTQALSEGACEGVLMLLEDMSVHGCSKSSAFEEYADDRIPHSESAHVFSVENMFSEGPREDTDDEDAHGFLEDVCKEDKEEDEEEEEEEEEEDSDEYTDALHEEALQDDLNQSTSSWMDAMQRHYMNPLGECFQEYISSVQTETRRELHETKMASFRGYGPQPRPFIKGSNCFNPHFEAMWLPWAIGAEYFHNEDMGLLVSDGSTGFTQRTLAAKQYMSSAVPILPVLEYMVNRSPGNKIAHIGSCSSVYWAALLQQLGAANVIVTEGSHLVNYTPADYAHFEQIEEEMFFMCNMAAQSALFFLRPSKSSSDAEPCMVERFLFCFPGDTIFFVGECGEHADNFNMPRWVEEHALDGWRVEEEMDIPCWPGSHDVFLCITKRSWPNDTII